MSRPLPDNPTHIHRLCECLGLGTPVVPMPAVSGGFHHRMWELHTDRGRFAVKQLAPDTFVSEPHIQQHYNASESAAEAFAELGIRAVHALRSGAGYLQVFDNIGYLVYPWCDAQAQPRQYVSREHALVVARMLANMHRANLQIDGLEAPPVDLHSQDVLADLVARAADSPWAAILERHLPRFLETLEVQESSLSLLRQQLVASHGDLDPKNVLWDDHDEPVIIDWESAHLLNPTFEILLEALDWSGIASHFDPGLFRDMLDAYRNAGGPLAPDLLAPAMDCILGDWLGWLNYNLARALDATEPEQQHIGAAQVELVLPIILRLLGHRQDLLAAAQAAPAGTGTGG